MLQRVLVGRALGRKRWVSLTTAVLATSALVAVVGYLRAGDPGADAPAGAEAKVQAHMDGHGDPLPPGAVKRLGTVRFRYGATSIAYSPDGKVLAVGGADNQIRLFDACTGKEIRRLAGHQPRTYSPPRDPKGGAFDSLVGSVGKGNVTTVAFTPDGKTLASGGWDEAIRLWDVASGKELRRLMGHDKGMVATVTFSHDGKYLASRGGNDGTVRLWDPATGKELYILEKVQRVNPWRFNRDSALAFAPDSKSLAVGDAKVIRLLEVPTGKEIQQLAAHVVCASLAYSADGKLLATGGVDPGKDQYSLRIWDLAAGKELRRCALPKQEPPISLAFSPDGNHLAAVVEEDHMHIFDVATGKPIQNLPQFWASRLAYAPDGKTLVSVRGATIRVWDPATGKERFLDFEGHQAGVASVALSGDGKRLVSGGENIRLWDAATGKPVRTIASSGAALALSHDGKTLASGGRDRLVHLWDVDSGKETGRLEGHTNPVRGLAYSPDGKLLASGDAQATVRLWDAATGKELHVIDMKSGAEHLSLAFSPDNKTLACAGAWNDSSFLPKKGATFKVNGKEVKSDGIFNIQGVQMERKEGYLVLLWDTATGKEVRRFEGLSDKVRSVAFSPDGKTLAAASKDGKIVLWDAATGKEILYIMAHPGQDDAGFRGSLCVAFAPDGKTLASASTDKTIRLWDVATAKELGKFQADCALYTIAFAPDGKTLVSGGSDTAVLIWDLVNPAKPQPAKPSNAILIGD